MTIYSFSLETKHIHLSSQNIKPQIGLFKFLYLIKKQYNDNYTQ